MAITKEQAIDILEKFDFFQGQRAGRELWNDKPFEVQEQDIKDFSNDVALLKQYIADVVPKSEVEALEREIERLKKSMLPSYYSACTEEEAIKRGKQYGRAEVAREIFEEIEKIMETLIYDYRKVSRYQDGDTVWYVKDFLLAELKKKYAGDNKE